MSKQAFKEYVADFWDIFKRSVGLGMVAFFPGAAVGALPIPFLHTDALSGGITSFLAMFSIAMSGLGTDLASKGYWTRRDVDRRFKEAVTKAPHDDSSQ